MTFTVNDFADLIDILNTHPEWRLKMQEALFPGLDVQTLERMLETQERILQRLGNLDERINRLETGMDNLNNRIDKLDNRVDKLDNRIDKLDNRVDKLDNRIDKLDNRVDKLDNRVDKLQVDVAMLKGDSYERKFRDDGTSIFGRFVRRGRDAKSDIADLLYEAEENNQISEAELEQVLVTDLLWQGKLRRSQTEVVLVLEASWTAEVSDVERAINRAEILQKIGLIAVPTVSGREWSAEALDLAKEEGVVQVIDLRVEPDSWARAMAQFISP